MTTHAAAKFNVKTWDEKTWDGRNWKEVAGAKLTQAAVTKTYQGDIEGEGTSHTLTTYDARGSAHYVGLEQVIGKIGARAGSFVLQVYGSYDVVSGLAKAEWSVVPGSGTEALAGLKGDGGFVAEHGNSEVKATLDYAFA
jgi:Protein of unknown function (DUF3224)